MLTKVSVKGQIVIPAEIRAKYAICPGDTVDVHDGDGKILVFPLPKDTIQAGRGFLKGPTSLTAALLKERAEDKAAEGYTSSSKTTISRKGE
jgi:AbrB family looped-hinge helix DNA binding protein